jgi:uncharacterized membrane protein YhaH (DUF805 family)
VEGSLENPPIVIMANRAQATWLVVGSAVLLAMGGVGLVKGFNAGSAFGLVFFGLTGAIGLWNLIAPPRLEFGPSGITQRVLWRTSRFAWADIYDFRPATVGLARKVVGFDYLKPNPKRDGLRRLNSSIAGVQGVFQSGWEIDPITLAALLNQARERWLGDAAPVNRAAPAPSPSGFAGFAGNRLNRKTFLIASALLIALSIGLGFLPGGARATGPVFTLFFIRLFAARLHDLGRSGWWQLVLYAVQTGIVIAVLDTGVLAAGLPPLDLALAAAFVVQLLFTAALGAIPGQSGENRFGPAPGQPSAAHEAEVFR